MTNTTADWASPALAFAIRRVPDDRDIDELGHVSNLVYLRWVQDVAKEHSESVGYDAEAYEALGAVFVVRRHEIDYLAPAYAGDRIRAVTWVETWRGASATRRTTIERDADGRALARAVTTWAYVNQKTGRPLRIPRDVTARFDAA